MNHAELVRTRVKTLLAQSGKTQKALASALGYKGKSSITEILAGRQHLPPDKYDAAAAFFGLSREAFLLVGKSVQPLHENPPTTPSVGVVSDPVASGAQAQITQEGWKMVLTNREALLVTALREKGLAGARDEIDDLLRAEAKARSRLQRSKRKTSVSTG